jgi:hypothetical protein
MNAGPRHAASAAVEPRKVLLADLKASPDLNRHVAIAWARLAGHRCAPAPSRVRVLKPFAF